jgi:hypothetical protein
VCFKNIVIIFVQRYKAMTDITVLNNKVTIFSNKIKRDSSFYMSLPSEKIEALVRALRLVSQDDEIRVRELLIPDECEKYGFSEGSHNLGELLHFLADMLEE